MAAVLSACDHSFCGRVAGFVPPGVVVPIGREATHGELVDCRRGAILAVEAAPAGVVAALEPSLLVVAAAEDGSWALRALLLSEYEFAVRQKSLPHFWAFCAKS